MNNNSFRNSTSNKKNFTDNCESTKSNEKKGHNTLVSRLFGDKAVGVTSNNDMAEKIRNSRN